MLPVNISYPLFESNQVLSYEHLNQLFDHLDEQGRLTRTNLIGIGIVCGLEPTIAASGDSIHISKGCGVTSEGYLITWGIEATLEWVRPYEVPDALPYREFGTGSNPFTPFPMWELTPDRNNDPTAVRVSRDFLRGENQAPGDEDEKILVLFLECLAESNRNCTPNSCDDKGTTVTATIRPLLIRKQDIDLLQARIRALGPEAEAYFSLANSMSTRLDLPTLKMPRFDVAATNLGSTSSVFGAFQRALNQPVVNGVASALSAAHQAFAPLLTDFASDPFANLMTNWAYLHDGSIEDNGQYLWYQYFYDHLDTVIQAYEEFRLRGLEVLGLCCPDSRLFKRHLFLGNLGVEPFDGTYRHDFVPSPLFTRQQGALAELRLLFQRLVTLVQDLELPPNVNNLVGQTGVGNFGLSTLRPALGFAQPIDTVFRPSFFAAARPAFVAAFRPSLATAIKITPSLLGGALSRKAIPYHYRPAPLYEQWSYELTRQGKARHNLGYRSNAWNTTDLFVRFPLQYDLEPHNFLRVEGHVGQNYVAVLNELIAQKNRSRLPIDIVALKSGFNADNVPLPNEVEGCHFQDLEALYQAFREELLCQICETIKRFYLTPILPNQTDGTFGSRIPNLPLLRQCAPNFRYTDDSIGAFYEDNLSLQTDTAPFLGDLNSTYIYHVYFIWNLVRLSQVLPANLSSLDMDTFRQRYADLANLMGFINNILLRATNDANPGDTGDANERLDLEEFSDQLDQILFACKLEPFQRIYDTYLERLNKVRESLLFNNFAKQHPGLQHKAGVPLGGTFVIVYHGEDQPDDVRARTGNFTVNGRVVADNEPLIGATVLQVGTSSGTVTDIDGNFQMMVDQLPVRLEVLFVGFESQEVLVVSEQVSLLIDLTNPGNENDNLGRFQNLNPGTVFADFFLPYLCCSDCAPIQFVLPKEPPTFMWEQVGCTTDNNTGEVLLAAAGGTAPYDYSIDGGVNWLSLGETPIQVNNGTEIQIRDAEGTLSVRRTVDLLPPLVIDQGSSECDASNEFFRVEVFINGGRPPYRVIANGETYNVPAGEDRGYATFPSGQGGEAVVQDSSNPPCERTFTVAPITCEQACDLPCGGITLDSGHPFWMQRNPNTQIRYQNVQLRVNDFSIFGNAAGQVVNFDTNQLEELTEILNPDRDFNSAGAFTSYWNTQFSLANEFVQSILGDVFNSPDEPVIRFGYDPTGVGNFTTLRIEHYECHRFRLELGLEFTASSTKHVYQRRWEYTEEGCQVSEQSFLTNFGSFSGEGRLPAFDIIRRDRCNPDEEPQSLCTESFDFEIGQEPTGDFQWLLFAQGTDNLPVLWMTEYALPAIAEGSQISLLAAPLGIAYEVRAIAVNPDTSCAAVATTTITS